MQKAPQLHFFIYFKVLFKVKALNPNKRILTKTQTLNRSLSLYKGLIPLNIKYVTTGSDNINANYRKDSYREKATNEL
jgi:hypothetical protein